jgi:four helix bundle protein
MKSFVSALSSLRYELFVFSGLCLAGGMLRIVGKQLLRCGTSVGANYRAACRARSKAEFIARLGIVAEEADESVFWLEMREESKMLNPKRLEEILKEARELAAIFSASLRTAKGNR